MADPLQTPPLRRPPLDLLLGAAGILSWLHILGSKPCPPFASKGGLALLPVHACIILPHVRIHLQDQEGAMSMSLEGEGSASEAEGNIEGVP